MWPPVFWLQSISESTSKKRGSECKGLHCDTIAAAFLISHVRRIFYEHPCNRLHVSSNAFTLRFRPVSTSRPFRQPLNECRGKVEPHVLLTRFLSLIISPAESLNQRKPGKITMNTREERKETNEHSLKTINRYCAFVALQTVTCSGTKKSRWGFAVCAR